MKKIILYIMIFCFLLTGCQGKQKHSTELPSQNVNETQDKSLSLNNIPEYSNQPYVVINNNKPLFKESDKKTKSFERYSTLDKLGRCQVAYANVGKDIMPTEKRGSIGMIKPTGWHTVKYDNVDGKYLYNRCHLIGYQLTGENANERNLITGTRYMNVEGMLPFENMVADYVKETNHHVLYRVTPIFEGDNLVVSGVTMEALSVEDDEIEFYVYVYNVQPGIEIDYQTGESQLKSLTQDNNNASTLNEKVIGNKKSKVYHSQSCSYLPAKKNQIIFENSNKAEKEGYRKHSCIK